MTKEQLIEAMTLIGYTETTDYTIGEDYDSIAMIELDPIEDTPDKPVEQTLQDVYDTEQARLAEVARKAAIQARIDALTDLEFIVQVYTSTSGQALESDDCINMALLQTVDKLESAEWYMANVLKPTIEDLEAAQTAATAKKVELVTNQDNEKYLMETDWKVLRHLREQILGLTTSMTQEEYEALEQERQDKAEAIVK